jgi:hypothetical protein
MMPIWMKGGGRQDLVATGRAAGDFTSDLAQQGRSHLFSWMGPAGLAEELER